MYVHGDLNDEAFVEDLAHRAAESFGTVDVVVLNHGLQVSGPLTEMAYDDAKNVLHSNLLSAFLVMKHFAPLMPPAGGSFVCVGSRLGMVGKADEVLYSAAKGGLIMLAKGAAIEWAPRNIRVNVVAPGLTATPIIEASFERRADPEAYRREREGQIPLQRLATPEEIADAILFLASSESSYITGAVLPVDGGYTAFRSEALPHSSALSTSPSSSGHSPRTVSLVSRHPWSVDTRSTTPRSSVATHCPKRFGKVADTPTTPRPRAGLRPLAPHELEQPPARGGLAANTDTRGRHVKQQPLRRHHWPMGDPADDIGGVINSIIADIKRGRPSPMRMTVASRAP